jgi:hypothetical protein
MSKRGIVTNRVGTGVPARPVELARLALSVTLLQSLRPASLGDLCGISLRPLRLKAFA